METGSLAQEVAGKSEVKSYTFVIFKQGTILNQDSTQKAEIQRLHLAYLDQLAETGNLNVAGLFLNNGNWRGILIFISDDTEKVKKLVDEDPAVKAGTLTYEVHPWMTQKRVTFK